LLLSRRAAAAAASPSREILCANSGARVIKRRFPNAGDYRRISAGYGFSTFARGAIIKFELLAEREITVLRGGGDDNNNNNNNSNNVYVNG